jgi:hypothetical protein
VEIISLAGILEGRLTGGGNEEVPQALKRVVAEQLFAELKLCATQKGAVRRD